MEDDLDGLLLICKLVPGNSLAALCKLVQLDLRAAEATILNQNELRRVHLRPCIHLSRVEIETCSPSTANVGPAL